MRIGLTAFGLIGFACAIPAAAQVAGPYIPNTGRAAASNSGKADTAAVRATMRQFGICAVSRFKLRVHRLIELAVDAPPYSRELLSIAQGECLDGGALKMPQPLFRGAIFEALYLSEFGRDPLPDFAAVKDSGYRQRYGAEVSDKARPLVALEQFGECVARSKGADIRALLQTQPGSAAESDAFDSLKDSFPPCIPTGETLTFSKAILRGALAEGIYWLSRAAPGQQTATR